jgi:hypothetical protein
VRNAGLATFVASCAWTACEAEDVAGSIIVWALAAKAFLILQRLSWLPGTERREHKLGKPRPTNILKF